jgi:hypothetical protein
MRVLPVSTLCTFACAAVCVGVDARAQEDPGEGTVRVEATSVSLSKKAPQKAEEPAELIQTDRGADGVRETPVAVAVGTTQRAGMSETPDVIREIKSLFAEQESEFRGWVRGTAGIKFKKLPPCTLRLGTKVSRLKLACPKEVQAGRPIVVKVDHAGNHNILWNAYLIYPVAADGYGDRPTDRTIIRPDNGRYEMQSFKAGAEVRGATGKTLRFWTYPADRRSLLGVRVENPLHAEDGHTFWVKVR